MAISWKFVSGSTIMVYIVLLTLVGLEVTVWAGGLLTGKPEVVRRLGLRTNMNFLAPSITAAATKEAEKVQPVAVNWDDDDDDDDDDDWDHIFEPLHHNEPNRPGRSNPSHDDIKRQFETMMQWLLAVKIALIGALAGCVSCQCLYGCYHYVACIKPTEHKYIPRGAIIPRDMHGDFEYGLCGCCGDMKLCCGFYCCFPWFLAELIFRAGHMHNLTDIPADSPATGWLYALASMWAMSFFQLTAFLPCVMAALRGGFCGNDLGSTKSLRTLFRMENSGCCTYTQDCCIWMYCPICAGVQEMRQVMSLLDRGVPQVGESGPGSVQMQVQTARAGPLPYGQYPPQPATAPAYGVPPPAYGAPPPAYGAPSAPPPAYGVPPYSAPPPHHM